MNARALLEQEQERLLACVHCGFCLTACPTYTRLGDESDSPRGRLYLMRAVMEGRLPPEDEAFATHIDRCLGCRACEPVCPSGVQYGFLLERARATIAQASGSRRSTRALLHVMATPSLTKLFGLGGRLLRAGGLAKLLARLTPPIFGRARLGLAMLAATRPWPGLKRAPRGARITPAASAGGPEDVRGSATGTNREMAEPHARAGGLRTGTGVQPPGAPAVAARSVAILEGCVQAALFARVNRATERVLRANGCAVLAAPGQGCCGALHAHSGDLEGARRLARANIEAFEKSGAETIVVNAAGCGAMMKEYGEQFEHDGELHERAATFSGKVRDVSEFLADLGLRQGASVALRVTFDAPCHLIHAQRITRAPLDVLAAVPGLEIVPLPGSEECCGGAGTYGMEHPQLGGRVLADKLEAIRDTGAAAVLTANPGCIMQIGAGLALRGEKAVALHPVEVLDESYTRLGEESGG